MKIAYINYFFDTDIRESEYLERYHSIHGWCKSISDLGCSATVYQRFYNNESFIKDDVLYKLIRDGKDSALKPYQNPAVFHKQIGIEKYEIIHVNSLRYIFQAYLLKKRFQTSKVVIQHHAEKPWSGMKQYIQKYFSSSIDGYIFSSDGTYYDWLKLKVIVDGKKHAEIMEGSTSFRFTDRSDIRQKTGITGNPVFLWVGRLNENKDPLTVLHGFSKIVSDFPGAKLYMIFSEDNLKPEIIKLCNQESGLRNSVNLIGFVDHKHLSDYYNSSDYFVLGSHYEGSGFSLAEAMACGVVPIVTDIYSFRTLTGNGKIGSLWKCGDADSFYRSAKIVLKRSLTDESCKAIEHFENNLSYPAIGNDAKKFYESLIS
jgi:glycosyltransferase involved in cell wall biosynthesis